MVEVFGSDWPDDAYIDARLRRFEFNRQVWNWSKADRKKLRREFDAVVTCGSADANFEVDWNRFMGNGDHARDYRSTVRWRMTQIVKKERKLHAMITRELGTLEGVDRELVRPVSRFEMMMPVSWEVWGRIHGLHKAAQAGPLDHRHANARAAVLQGWKNTLGVPNFR